MTRYDIETTIEIQITRTMDV